ncbi:MAG: serine/threonine protein kinase [Alphaproteobacteria bacterium]|nr:serine/threonine protein kinase [Alphaproteobacteria bacterium]
MRTLTFNRIIGMGSFGTVYHAELRVPRGFSRQCAVKVMKSTSPDQEHFRARMRDEARLLGMLQDEQILGVSELVKVEGRDIVVMEYVEGVDLSDIIQNHRVPPRALAELGAEMAGTLDRAHTAKHPNTGEPLKVVHRDVKPANVMVTRRGGVRLLDFGVARAAFASRESETQGLVLGTLNYFPPEILAGADPSPAVDIYGLGLILWECATGKEWGSPQVHRKRFERRVQQRLAVIEDEYASLLPVMKAILNWDPAARPAGREVEALLLKAADSCTGEGLRTWARDVVPPILDARARELQQDELVGRTLPIEGEDPSFAPLQPLPQDLPDLPERPMDSMTFNDLAPPAAVDRRREKEREREQGRGPAMLSNDMADDFESPTELAIPRKFGEVDSVPGPPPRQPEAKPKAKAARISKPQPPAKKKRKGGVPSVWLVVAIAIVLGSVIGAVLVVAVAVALFAIRMLM